MSTTKIPVKFNGYSGDSEKKSIGFKLPVNLIAAEECDRLFLGRRLNIVINIEDEQGTFDNMKLEPITALVDVNKYSRSKKEASARLVFDGDQVSIEQIELLANKSAMLDVSVYGDADDEETEAGEPLPFEGSDSE